MGEGGGGVKLHILRLSHIYGPRDNRQYSIPIWLQAKYKSQKIEFTAKPDAKRNLLYIDDCCRFIARACYLKENIPLINVVSSQTIPLFEIAQIIATITENEVIYCDDRIAKDKHVEPELRLSCILCERYLGQQMVSLEEGLSREFEYYKSLMERGCYEEENVFYHYTNLWK